MPNGWVTDGTYACSHADYPGGDASSCWTADSFECAKPDEGYPLLHVHGTADDEEPFEMVVAQYRFYATRVLGCTGEREEYRTSDATCYQYMNCSHRAALCVVDGLGHNIPVRHRGWDFDAIETAINYWRGGWTNTTSLQPTAAPAIDTAPEEEAPDESPTGGGKKVLSGGAIAGIVVGSAAGVAGLGAAAYFKLCRPTPYEAVATAEPG